MTAPDNHANSIASTYPNIDVTINEPYGCESMDCPSVPNDKPT